MPAYECPSIPYQEDETSLILLRLLQKDRGAIKGQFLLQALSTCSASFIAEIFRGQTIIWTEESALECLKEVLHRDEELVWETLKSVQWPYPKGILAMAIEARNLCFVKWLLRQTEWTEDDRLAAWDCGDLEIIECFFSKEEMTARLMGEKELKRFFLFSPLYKIQAYPELSAIYRETLGEVSLVARYTQPRVLPSFARDYEIDLQRFVQEQIAFGRSCNQAVLQALDTLYHGQKELQPILDIFVRARTRIAMDKRDIDTANFSRQRDLFPQKYYSTVFDPIYAPRYQFVLPWIKKYNKKSDLRRAESGYGYVLEYQNHALTRIILDQKLWLHPPADAITALYPRLQQLHQEILEMKCDDVDAFCDKVAECYWLGCNLVLTYRGNAQNFLMWLQTIMLYHGFEPLVAKREIPQPDCMAISLPLADFIAFFPSFFENPFYVCLPGTRSE